MGVLSNLFSVLFDKSGTGEERYKFGSETEAEIKRLSKWQSSRIPDIEMYSMVEYRPESGEEIKLWKLEAPANGNSGDKIVKQIKTFYEGIVKEIESFRSYTQKLSMLKSELREDDFFPEIDHLFANKLKRLYNELLFCKVEKLVEYDYNNTFFGTINAIYDDLKILNAAFVDYMYALSQTEFENNKQDLELIRIRVESMRQAVQKNME